MPFPWNPPVSASCAETWFERLRRAEMALSDHSIQSSSLYQKCAVLRPPTDTRSPGILTPDIPWDTPKSVQCAEIAPTNRTETERQIWQYDVAVKYGTPHDLAAMLAQVLRNQLEMMTHGGR